MVLSVGIISACIVAKKRKGSLTRLEKLQKKLRSRPLTHKTLYSYPIKTIFQICLIVAFASLLFLWLEAFRSQLHEIAEKLNVTADYSIDAEHVHLLNEYKKNDASSWSMSNIQTTELYKRIQLERKYQSVKRTVCCIIGVFTIPLAILLFQTLRFRRLKIQKIGRAIPRQHIHNENVVSDHQVGKLTVEELAILGWKTIKEIQIFNSDRIRIELCGTDSFTFKDTYYSVKRCSRNSVAEQQEAIIDRGCVFEARKTLIYICSILGMEIDLSIINGPTQVVKGRSHSAHKPESQTKEKTA